MFNQDERNLLGALADILIPAGDEFPSASQADVATTGLDQVLKVRPEIVPGLKTLLAAAQGHSPAAALARLRTEDPANFSLLGELAAGAYFLHPLVRAKLGYDGQTPRAIDPRPDYLDDGLLQSVIDRGPIYRPTPP